MSDPRNESPERLLDVELLGNLTELEDTPDGSYMTQLLEDFALDARKTLDRMRSLAGRGKACAIASEAHRLRGSSGSIGAPGLAHGYSEIETRARAGATRVLPAQIEATSSLLDQTMVAFREFLRARRGRSPRDSSQGL